jgi:CheY-like chemotaxis protein
MSRSSEFDPDSEPASGPASGPPSSPASGRVARYVLLADDSPVARLAIARRLRAEGFRVVEGGTVNEAIARAESAPGVACALLDLDLGDGDGRRVAERLRVERGDLPIAFFSDVDSDDAAESARTMGPVFAKPHELDAAVTWVKRHAK